MATLGQDEIDNLLKGLNSGEIETETDTPEEDDAVAVFNLANQDRIIRGRMPVLEIINDRFAKLCTNSLSNSMRKRIEFNPSSIDVVKFGDFMKTLAVPSSIHVFKMEPLRGNALMVIDAKLVFALVENFFGGSGSKPKIEGREFTPIEQSIIVKVAHTILKNIEEAWFPVHELQLELVRSEINPQFASIVPPSEVVIIVSFEVELDSALGKFEICLPYPTIEPIRTKLHANFQTERLEVDHSWVARLKERIMETSLNIRVELGRTQITSNQLLKLKSGDIIMLNTEVDSVLPIEIEGVAKFWGTPGVLRANKAMLIVKEEKMKLG
ncbi:MAG: flagellar motor switch protein FliM [Desulfovibrionaceae bacterium]|nr:flagellar motor switch protein FliM [Desulfovibrionaceae bacterium]